MKTGDVSKFAE